MIWIFQVVNHYEEGVLLRLGKYKKSLPPGLHFKIPFADRIITQFAKDDTILLPSQVLTTVDDITVTVRAQITYYIDDIKMFLVDVNDCKQAVSDVAIGCIGDVIIKNNYEDFNSDYIINQVNINVRKEAKKWGVYIVKIKFASISKSRTINLIKDVESHL